MPAHECCATLFCVNAVGAGKPLADYNALPRGDFRRLKIEIVDATDSSIMETGFPHFQGLAEFKQLKLKNCV